MSPMPSWRWPKTARSSGCVSSLSSTPAPTCNPASRPTPAISARSPACTARPPPMWKSTAVFTHTMPCRPYRGNGRPEAAYVIERMVDLAAREMNMDPAEMRRKNYIPPEAMPFKSSVTFTYDCGEFEKGMDLALKLADVAGFAKRRAESKRNGKLRGLGMSNTIERAAAAGFEGAEIRFDRTGTVRCCPAASTRARATRPRSSRWSATSSASIPTTSSTSRATPTRCSSARAPAGRARPPCRLGIPQRGREDHHQGQGDRRPQPQGRRRGRQVRRKAFLAPKTNRTMTIKDVAKTPRTRRGCRRPWRSGCSPPPPTRPRSRTSRTACTSARSRSTRRPADRDVALQRGRRRRHRDQPAAAEGPDRRRRREGRRPDLWRTSTSTVRPDHHRLVHGLRHAARPRFCNVEVKANPVPTKTNPLGVKGAGEAGCVGAMPAVANAVVDALSEFGVASHRDAGDAGAGVAGDRERQGRVTSPLLRHRHQLQHVAVRSLK